MANPVIAQTFIVDGGAYPSGVVLDSIDLCFKDVPTQNQNPVTLQIRPTVNGYPSGSTIIPFSQVVKLPYQITTSTAPGLECQCNQFQVLFSCLSSTR